MVNIVECDSAVNKANGNVSACLKQQPSANGDAAKTDAKDSSDSADKTQIGLDGLKDLSAGKRERLCGNVGEATRLLATACEKVTESFGQLAKECAPVYLEYGLALLDLSRLESTLINPDRFSPEKNGESAEDPAVEGTSSELPDQPSADSAAQSSTESAEPEKPPASDANAKTPSTGLPEEAKATEEANSTEESDAAANSNKEPLEPVAEEEAADENRKVEDGEGDSGDDDGDEGEDADDDCEENVSQNEEDEENLTNLQLAWENLDTARLIFERENDKANVAECKIHLAEVAMESENFQDALVDLLEALDIVSAMEENERRVAEVHFQMGLCYVNMKDYPGSEKQFKTCIEALQGKKALLAKSLATSESEAKEHERIKAEMADLDLVIQDVEERCKDAVSCQDLTPDQKSEIEETTSPVKHTTLGSAKEPSKTAVKDITHLLRKVVQKRTSEPATDETGPDPKRVKIDGDDATSAT